MTCRSSGTTTAFTLPTIGSTRLQQCSPRQPGLPPHTSSRRCIRPRSTRWWQECPKRRRRLPTSARGRAISMRRPVGSTRDMRGCSRRTRQRCSHHRRRRRLELPARGLGCQPRRCRRWNADHGLRLGESRHGRARRLQRRWRRRKGHLSRCRCERDIALRLELGERNPPSGRPARHRRYHPGRVASRRPPVQLRGPSRSTRFHSDRMVARRLRRHPLRDGEGDHRSRRSGQWRREPG